MFTPQNWGKGCLWLIGGTTESATLATAIVQAQLPCIVTVTTASACTLYPQTPLLKVLVGQIDLSQVGSFLRQQQIIAVVDASHPYAVEISKSAIATTAQAGIPYLRYERPCVSSSDPSTLELDSFEALLQGDYLTHKRVLLTLGYKSLPLFQPWQTRSTLFARFLPSQIALETALKAGFTPDRLICFRPPISAELEAALWRQWNVSVVVTKASGEAGGERIKRSVAQELGVQLIVIQRPAVNYPQQTSDLKEVLRFCQQVIH